MERREMSDKSLSASIFLTGQRGWAFSVWAANRANGWAEDLELVAHEKDFDSQFAAERAANAAIAKARESSRLSGSAA
jgi:hypothetical protein